VAGDPLAAAAPWTPLTGIVDPSVVAPGPGRPG
jgi:hypothetical protein